MARLSALFAIARDDRRRNGRITKATLERFRQLMEEANAASGEEAEEVAYDCGELLDHIARGIQPEERDLYTRRQMRR